MGSEVVFLLDCPAYEVAHLLPSGLHALAVKKDY